MPSSSVHSVVILVVLIISGGRLGLAAKTDDDVTPFTIPPMPTWSIPAWSIPAWSMQTYAFTFPPFPTFPTFPPIPTPWQNFNAPDTDCLACICQASSNNCNLTAGCNATTGLCGPYQLSRTFYQEECSGFIVGNVLNITIPWSGPQPGDFERCASDRLCSERCITRYMQRNGYTCQRGYTPTCNEFQRVPFGGNSACNSEMAQSFWNQITQCYANSKRYPWQPTSGPNDNRNPIPTIAPSGNDRLVDRKCLDCICKAQSNCNMDIGCLGPACGPYQLTWDTYMQCRVDGGGHAKCSQDKECSELCIQRYMAIFAKSCTGRDQNTCADYARIYVGGPLGCNSTQSADYWSNKIKKCYNGSKTVNQLTLLPLTILAFISCFF